MKRNLLLLTVLLVISISACNNAVKEINTTISGNVSHNGEAVSDTYVLLLELGNEVTHGLSLSNGIITNSNGNYTIFAVNPGNYYVAAIDDTNNNFIFDIDTDKVGYYGNPDTLGFTIPRMININKGEKLEHINITNLYKLQ